MHVDSNFNPRKMETLNFISTLKGQRGNLVGLDYLFRMYFEINKNVGFEDLENYSEIIKEYLDFIVLKNNLNISNTNPVFIEYDRTKRTIQRSRISASRNGWRGGSERRIIVKYQ